MGGFPRATCGAEFTEKSTHTQALPFRCSTATARSRSVGTTEKMPHFGLWRAHRISPVVFTRTASLGSVCWEREEKASHARRSRKRREPAPQGAQGHGDRDLSGPPLLNASPHAEADRHQAPPAPACPRVPAGSAVPGGPWGRRGLAARWSLFPPSSPVQRPHEPDGSGARSVWTQQKRPDHSFSHPSSETERARTTAIPQNAEHLPLRARSPDEPRGPQPRGQDASHARHTPGRVPPTGITTIRTRTSRRTSAGPAASPRVTGPHTRPPELRRPARLKTQRDTT